MESERAEFLQQLDAERHVLFRANVEDWSGVIRTAREIEFENPLRVRAKEDSKRR